MAEAKFNLKGELNFLKSISFWIVPYQTYFPTTCLPKADFAVFWFLEFFITSPEGIHTYSNTLGHDWKPTLPLPECQEN